ncbi:MAG TPA: NB-ARC domain-containing protein [Candidatus Angelobacter sp.]|jgi:WD40 repeat protein|nr:NB-ARC domain-containing protein [Candidatus Angelobacter sp.]
MHDRPRVFISYCRSDGLRFACDLRIRLQEQHPEIPLWQDVISEQGGRNWWIQITEALDVVEFMVLVMTADALKSETVRKEWRYARQRGVCVYPVIGSQGLDFAGLPSWIRDQHFYDLDLQWEKFVNDLNVRCETPRVPFMVADLPEHFVDRPKEFNQLIEYLSDRGEKKPKELKEPVAITAALQGAGGFGKTTIARALCHSERVQEIFHDGILWVTLGENPGSLILKVIDLIEVLSGKRPGFQTEDAAANGLRELLANRNILIVIDDVWKSTHLDLFLSARGSCGYLLTTRILNALPTRARRVSVDAMHQDEAITLLSAGLEPNSNEKRLLRELASNLGDWPMLLSLANGVIRHRVIDLSEPLTDALDFVSKDLRENGLTAFDASLPEKRSEAVAVTMTVTLRHLGDDVERYKELAIFPQDLNIPLALVTILWEATANFSPIRTLKLCDKLANFSLLHHLSATHIKLHSVMRQYLASQLSNASKVHSKLAESWKYSSMFLSDEIVIQDNRKDGQLREFDWIEGGNSADAYYFSWLAYHLREAGRIEDLQYLLLNPQWIRAKLARSRLEIKGVFALLADYEFVPANSDLQLVRQSLRLAAPALARDSNQLTGQVCGRLKSVSSSIIDGFTIALRNAQKQAWLEPLWSTLPQAGESSVLLTLADHDSEVTKVVITRDEKLAISISAEETLKVWNLHRGEKHADLTSHIYAVSSIAINEASGHPLAVSASYDTTLKVWNLETAEELFTLAGHADWVSAVAITGDGRHAISVSDDKTIKVWSIDQESKDWPTRIGEESVRGPLYTLASDLDSVTTLTVAHSSDRVIAGSKDGILKIWNLQNRTKIYDLIGHSAAINAVTITDDGTKAISASADSTLGIWDLTNGNIIHFLLGHTDEVNAVAITPDNTYAVSASKDKTLIVWDIARAIQVHRLEGHIESVTAIAITADGNRAVSASTDTTLKVWDLSTGTEINTLVGHRGPVNAVAITANGQEAISASDDRTIKIWDLKTKSKARKEAISKGPITIVGITNDGERVVSESYDNGIKIWSEYTSKSTSTFQSYFDIIEVGRAESDVILSNRKTLNVWDASSSIECTKMNRYFGELHPAAIMSGGKFLVSASSNGGVKVWGFTRAIEYLSSLSNSHVKAPLQLVGKASGLS